MIGAMLVIAQVAAALAGLIHVFFFYLESVAFIAKKAYRRFLVTTEAEALTIRPWAMNQGFYNLFLAVGTLTGVVVWLAKHETIGRSLIAFGCASMLAAAAVLLASDRRMGRPAAIQGVLPLIALATMWF
jgi:putative membrane protein